MRDSIAVPTLGKNEAGRRWFISRLINRRGPRRGGSATLHAAQLFVIRDGGSVLPVAYVVLVVISVNARVEQSVLVGRYTSPSSNSPMITSPPTTPQPRDRQYRDRECIDRHEGERESVSVRASRLLSQTFSIFFRL